jgi:hypothetical protein
MALEVQGWEAISGDGLLGGRVPRWYMVSHGKKKRVYMSVCVSSLLFL